MPIRLSDATQESTQEPTRLSSVRLGTIYNPTNIEFSTLKSPESVDIQKKRGLWDQTKYFLGEAIGKPIARGVQKIPASLESGFQGIIDNMRNDVKKRLVKEGAVFGISDEEFNARTPEQQKRIDEGNKQISSLNRAEEVSKNLQKNWIDLANKGFAKRDESVFEGDFMKNPSWTRAVALGMESAPLLGIAAAITAATKSPMLGASAIGVMQGVDERANAKDAGLSTEDANTVFLSNAIVNSALENIPLTKFLKGGSLPLKAFEKGISKRIGTAIEVGATEATEEALQQVWTNSVAKIGYDNTRNLTEGLVESVIAGGISGGLIGSFSPSSSENIDTLIKEAESQGVDTDKMIEVVSQQVQDNGDAISGAILDKVNTFKNTAESNINVSEPVVTNDISRETNNNAIDNNVVKEDLSKVDNKVIPETIKVPKSQLPVGEGQQKVSKLAARIKDKLGDLSESDKSNLDLYNVSNQNEQIKRASEYVINNPEDAMRVLKGEIETPKGLLKNSIFIAMAENSIGDSNLALRLASLASTRSGQEISILQKINKDSPIRYIEDLQRAKIEAYGPDEKTAKEKIKESVSKEVKNIKKEISKKSPKIKDWNVFIESIRC